MLLSFFSLSIYSGFNHSPPPEFNLSASVSKCERLDIRRPGVLLGWPNWAQVTCGGCRFENSAYVPDSL